MKIIIRNPRKSDIGGLFVSNDFMYYQTKAIIMKELIKRGVIVDIEVKNE